MVRSPVATSLLLGMEVDQDIVDIELRNPNLDGITLRDLRLPLDTLIQSIHRNGHMIISHGYTHLELGDRVTVVGSVESLEEVMLHFEA
jgi:Trk K+ transport system NAD-binding subunit